MGELLLKNITVREGCDWTIPLLITDWINDDGEKEYFYADGIINIVVLVTDNIIDFFFMLERRNVWTKQII